MGVIETASEILGYSTAPDVPVKGAKRSERWPEVRDAFLRDHPRCAVCDGKEGLQVHHVIPFQYGGPELDPDNLITLCSGTFHCHLLFGHWGDFASVSPTVRADAELWRFRFKVRRVLTRMAKKELKRLREAVS